MNRASPTAASASLVSCHSCHLLSRGGAGNAWRCGHDGLKGPIIRKLLEKGKDAYKFRYENWR